MGFIICEKNTITWPVEYNMPVDGGKYQKVQFLAEFKRVSQSRYDHLMEQARKGEIDDEKFIDEVLVGWSGIKHAVQVDGRMQHQEFEYSEANKRALLDMYPGMRAAIVHAHTKSVVEAVRKN